MIDADPADYDMAKITADAATKSSPPQPLG